MVLTWNGFLPTSGHARLKSNPTLSFLLSQCSWQNQGDVLLILTSQYSQLCGQHIILLLFPLNNSHHNGQCLCCLPAAHTTNRQPPFTRAAAAAAHCLPPGVSTSAPCSRCHTLHPRLPYPAAAPLTAFSGRDRWQAVPPDGTGHCTRMCSHHSSGAFTYSSVMTGASLGEKYPLFSILANLFRWIPEWGWLRPEV